MSNEKDKVKEKSPKPNSITEKAIKAQPAESASQAGQAGQIIGIALIVMAALISLVFGTLAKKYEESKTSLEQYEVYSTFNQKYQEQAKNLVKQYLSEGKTREEATVQAITDTINQQYEDNKEFAEKYLVDKDWNGVYDSIENGEITEEEIEQHFKELNNELNQ